MGNYQSRLLINYLPLILRKVREYRAITEAEQPEIFALFDRIQFLLDNQFIETATEYGVSRWERLLNILPKGTQTLDERKFAIYLRLAETLPFTYRRLVQLLDELCGEGNYEIELNHGDYELTVLLEMTVENKVQAVKTMLRRIVPANMQLNVSLKFNFTHGNVFVGAQMVTATELMLYPI